jgi:diguanylate cyclase (GGDEF)-like protein
MRSPRLVLLFAVLTALGVAVAAAVILVVVREADATRAHDTARDRARFAARAVLTPELRPSDFTTVSYARRRRLDRFVRGRVLIEGMREAALYGRNGRQVYSATRSTPDHSTSARVRDALAGDTVSEIARGADGTRLLRTYIPIAGHGGAVTGVVRLDQDDRPIAAAIRRSALLIAGVLEGLLILLFVALVPVLARASARIHAHIAELEHVATHDDLTGLLNRVGLRGAMISRFAREEPAAVLLVDLDGFSEIGGSLGPASSDLVVVEAAERLQRELRRRNALVARFGEDVFGVLVDVVGEADAEALSELLVDTFTSEPFVADGVRLAVAAHVGVGLFPEHGCDTDTVLSRASTALRAAKEDDRARVEVYGDTHRTRDHNRMAVVAELRDALAAGQLRVHYQPQADFLTHQIRGVEALVRWEHPQRGLLPAGEFIADAERGGLAQELRRFVVNEALLQWRTWYEHGFDLELAVNLSALDMLDPGLPDEIEFAAARHEIPLWSLVLEITERALIADERRARNVVERLDEMGVGLAIDDFGTGFSSLASLRTFPIRQVKLDRSLLADVPGDEGAKAIVGGSVEIAHGVGALVVAEGIETREQWRFAQTMGCDIAQGYLVGRAAPADALLGLFEAPRVVPLAIA